MILHYKCLNTITFTMPARLAHQRVAMCNTATAFRASPATTAGYPARRIECCPALLVVPVHTRRYLRVLSKQVPLRHAASRRRGVPDSAEIRDDGIVSVTYALCQ